MKTTPFFISTVWAALSAIVSLSSFQAVAATETVSLEGQWRFELDRADAGLAEKWFSRSLAGQVALPGSLPAQGIGDPVTTDTKWTGGIVDRSWFTAPEYAKYREPGNIKVPFWLQPDTYYAGAAWYQRDIDMLASWEGRRFVLFLERPHWETRVWVDSRLIGTNNALATPHEYDLGSLSPGQHRLTIRVDNRMVVDVGHDSHSVSDHTQGNWNGLVGRLELQVGDPVWVEDVQVYADAAARTIRIRQTLRNTTGKVAQGKVSLFIEPGPGAAPLSILPSGKNFNTDLATATLDDSIPLGAQAQLWDEFSPALYRLRVNVRGEVGGQAFDNDTAVTFGLRDVSTQGTQFMLNGRRIFIRGTLECCIFPKTGHPPTNVESWKRLIRTAKSYGLNNIRFHSWCPPEAAFVAADELGFYYQVECSSWANSTTGLGQGKPIDRWIYEEADRILRYYGNHPSFLLMPYGNEPGGNYMPFLAKWVTHYKTKDPRRLYTSASGWPQIPENQFHVTPDPRIQAWGAGLKSRINAQPPETRTDYRDYIRQRTVPVISHEIGQWCVYPNFDEIPKYTGYLKPKNFEIFRDTLQAHHLGSFARQFLLASGKLQALCYKEDIESALRTPGMGGFQLLDLHDFPGQGTALVGVLDPFWESKGYISAQEFRRFCNSTVILARLARRVFTSDQVLEADLEIAHFGPAPLPDAVTTWCLVAGSDNVCAIGRLPAKTIPVNNGIALGSVRIALTNVAAPARCKIIASLEGDRFANDWDLWVYPPQVKTQPSPDVTIVDDFDEQALAALNAGGKVLFLVPPQRVQNAAKDKVMLGFSSIFWNTAWTRRQAPTTLGILCDPQHPALAQFPTEYHSNWQWWYLISRAGAMILDGLPVELQPTVAVIDDWVTARRLGLIVEGKCGNGKLLVCSIDLKNGLEQDPVARQLRASLLSYMGTSKFDPPMELSAEQVRQLTVQTRTF